MPDRPITGCAARTRRAAPRGHAPSPCCRPSPAHRARTGRRLGAEQGALGNPGLASAGPRAFRPGPVASTRSASGRIGAALPRPPAARDRSRSAQFASAHCREARLDSHDDWHRCPAVRVHRLVRLTAADPRRGRRGWVLLGARRWLLDCAPQIGRPGRQRRRPRGVGPRLRPSRPGPPPFTTMAWRTVHIAGGSYVYWDSAFGSASLTFDLELPGDVIRATDWACLPVMSCGRASWPRSPTPTWTGRCRAARRAVAVAPPFRDADHRAGAPQRRDRSLRRPVPVPRLPLGPALVQRGEAVDADRVLLGPVRASSAGLLALCLSEHVPFLDQFHQRHGVPQESAIRWHRPRGCRPLLPAPAWWPPAGHTREMRRRARPVRLAGQHDPAGALQPQDLRVSVNEQNMIVIWPFWRRCAIVSAPLPVRSRYATVPGRARRRCRGIPWARR